MTGRKRDIDDLQGEIQELFADLWQVPRFSGLRQRLPAAVRLLPHRTTRRRCTSSSSCRASTRRRSRSSSPGGR